MNYGDIAQDATDVDGQGLSCVSASDLCYPNSENVLGYLSCLGRPLSTMLGLELVL